GGGQGGSGRGDALGIVAGHCSPPPAPGAIAPAKRGAGGSGKQSCVATRVWRDGNRERSRIRPHERRRGPGTAPGCRQRRTQGSPGACPAFACTRWPLPAALARCPLRRSRQCAARAVILRSAGRCADRTCLPGSPCMKSYVAAALGLLLVACQPTSSSAPDAGPAASGAPAASLVDADHIDGVLRDMVASDEAVGVSALVYERGQEAYFGAFGMADREAGRPMQRDTLAQIYSMTKPVTGVVLMTLYDEGRFQLDDPLARHLPEYADVRVYAGEDEAGQPLLEAPGRPILVRDILRHTAGFAAAFEDDAAARLYREAGIDTRELSLEEMSRRLAEVPLAYQPGTRWLYGISVDVQARLAEVLAGKPFAQLVRE